MWGMCFSSFPQSMNNPVRHACVSAKRDDDIRYSFQRSNMINGDLYVVVLTSLRFLPSSTSSIEPANERKRRTRSFAELFHHRCNSTRGRHTMRTACHTAFSRSIDRLLSGEGRFNQTESFRSTNFRLFSDGWHRVRIFSRARIILTN